jgi:DNA-binding response OmpR family regulator
MIRPDAKPDGATGEAPQAPRVLLAEDDDEMRTLLEAYLLMAGYAVKAVANGVAVIRAIREDGWKPDVLVTDVHMPLMSGLEVLRRLTEAQAAPPTIVITSFGDRETHARARELGAVNVLDKPFDSARLVAAVNALLRPD